MLDNGVRKENGIKIKVSTNEPDDKENRKECVCCGRPVEYVSRNKNYNNIHLHNYCISNFMEAIQDLMRNNHKIIMSTTLQQ
jgi:hypothetical protein